jgi:hypothetical protein
MQIIKIMMTVFYQSHNKKTAIKYIKGKTARGSIRNEKIERI